MPPGEEPTARDPNPAVCPQGGIVSRIRELRVIPADPILLFLRLAVVLGAAGLLGCADLGAPDVDGPLAEVEAPSRLRLSRDAEVGWFLEREVTGYPSDAALILRTAIVGDNSSDKIK